ncbi:MAG: hypothetical protein CSA45_04375 [Gammaproteobacteria bacterium]|nr:MAG: hypothetical protein CSA45_04375 [Gammaproteobacteria bacterium]
MDQLELFPIPSPCIGVCESNNRGYCKGCLRSRDERLHWLSLNGLQKHNVLRLCRLRRQRLIQLARQRQRETMALPEQLDFGF